MKKNIQTKHEIKKYKFKRELPDGSWMPVWHGSGPCPLVALKYDCGGYFPDTYWAYTSESNFVFDGFIVFIHPDRNQAKDFIFKYEEVY